MHGLLQNSNAPETIDQEPRVSKAAPIKLQLIFNLIIVVRGIGMELVGNVRHRFICTSVMYFTYEHF